jgi:hypothetical protein
MTSDSPDHPDDRRDRFSYTSADELAFAAPSKDQADEAAKMTPERAARFGYGEDWDGTGILINGKPLKELPHTEPDSAEAAP